MLGGSEVMHLSLEHALDDVNRSNNLDEIATGNVDLLGSVRLEPCNNRLDFIDRRCDQIKNLFGGPPFACRKRMLTKMRNFDVLRLGFRR